MKPNNGLLALCLVAVLAFSFAAIIQRQNEASITNLRYDLLAIPSAIGYASVFAEKVVLPENITRASIFSFIQANPGVQFRAICSSLGLSIGVVQFHLAVLEKNGFIHSLLKGKYKRFFVAGKFSRREMEIIATLKLDTVRNILKTLLGGKRFAHHEIAAKLSISSQGLTWQMNRLQQTGLIEEKRTGINVSYSINTEHTNLITQTMALIEKPDQTVVV